MTRDEHEMMVEYSEMTSFNFNSKEFHDVANDYIECKNMVSSFNRNVKNFAKKFKPAKGWN